MSGLTIEEATKWDLLLFRKKKPHVSDITLNCKYNRQNNY